MNNERTTRGEVVAIVLGIIAVAGIVSVATIAPNALEVVALSRRLKKRYNVKAYLDRTTKRLVERGLVRVHTRGGKDYARLTPKGRTLLSRYQLHEYKLPQSRRWDQRWHVVIFDIKERQKYLRDALRRELLRMGFVMLQNSVWVYPYECQELIALLRASFLLKKEVLYMAVNEVEHDGWLRRHFKLP